MTTPMGIEQLWTVHEVAAYLKTSTSFVYKASAAGLLPTIRIGALVRFDPSEIRAFVGGQTPRK